MDRAEFVQLLFLLVTGIFVTIGALLAFIFTWFRRRMDKIENDIEAKINGLGLRIDDRLRTLTHEDRDIRTQISGLMTLFLETIGNRKTP